MLMNRPVLNNIELPATDMGASKAFYTEVFGWSWTEYGPTYSAADASGIEVGLSTGATPAALPPTGDESSVGPLVLFQVNDLDRSIGAVIASGGEIVTGTFGFPGGTRFHFRDPSGNVLGIYRLDTD
jgi:predicted enzyme related to lactoylglutathione lyase